MSPESVKEKDKQLDRKEEEEKGREYLKRLDEEEAAAIRAQFEQQFGPDSDDDGVDMEEDFEIPQELLDEFCNDAELNPESGELEPPKKKLKLNTMKIPNLILMVLKNNTPDQEAADIATGQNKEECD